MAKKKIIQTFQESTSLKLDTCQNFNNYFNLLMQTKTTHDKNAFQWEAYRPLVDRIPSMHCGRGHWCVYLPRWGCTWHGGVPSQGVPAGECTCLGGVPTRGVYLAVAEGVLARGCTCSWGGGCTCQEGVYLPWGYLNVNKMTDRQVLKHNLRKLRL